MSGLVAFWHFGRSGGTAWRSCYDRTVMDRALSILLRRIGDERSYAPADWPYDDANGRLQFDRGGPFGHAVRFNGGYIFGAVERERFDGTLLELHGKRPFTLVAWVKFVGRRHLVAGIWDEGGWDRYAGRRQAALFAGLFGQQSVIAHVSATGAASYPQSTHAGSQFARLRALDGQPFGNDTWVAMALTHDPARAEVCAYLNGKLTPMKLTDPVAQDLFQYPEEQIANPFRFSFPIFAPRAFLVKFNGHDYRGDAVKEHRLFVDLNRGVVTYEREGGVSDAAASGRVRVDIRRRGRSILAAPLVLTARPGQRGTLPAAARDADGDQVWCRLEKLERGRWTPVGTPVVRTIGPGAPFTLGRALGLGTDELEHGSQLYMDGVAVFSRVLAPRELTQLSFNL